MFCKNCGTELDLNAAFCPQCGKSVSDNQAVKKTIVISTKKFLAPVVALILIISIALLLIKPSNVNSSPEKVAVATIKSEYEADVKTMIDCFPEFVVKELAVKNGLSMNASRKDVVKEIQKAYRGAETKKVEIISTKVVGEGTTEDYTIFRELFDYLTDEVYDSIEKIAKVEVEYDVGDYQKTIKMTCIKIDNKWYYLRGLT